jgi:hypothetical protein
MRWVVENWCLGQESIDEGLWRLFPTFAALIVPAAGGGGKVLPTAPRSKMFPVAGIGFAIVGRNRGLDIATRAVG